LLGHLADVLLRILARINHRHHGETPRLLPHGIQEVRVVISIAAELDEHCPANPGRPGMGEKLLGREGGQRQVFGASSGPQRIAGRMAGKEMDVRVDRVGRRRWLGESRFGHNRSNGQAGSAGCRLTQKGTTGTARSCWHD